MVVDKLKSDKALADEQVNVLKAAGYDVTRLDGGRKLVLITGHRRENFGEGFISMVTAMKDLSEKYPDVDFVYLMEKSTVVLTNSGGIQEGPPPAWASPSS